MLNSYLEKNLYALSVQPIVVELDTSKLSAFFSKVAGLNLTITGNIPTFGFAAIAPVSPSVIKKINGLPGVKTIHANRTNRAIQLPAVPAVPAIGADWWPTSESRNVLEAELAIKEGFTGEMVKLGVADTGIDALHPQLMGSEWYSTISWPAREILDENGHGSHCASTASGKLYFSPLGVSVEGVSKGPVISCKCLGRGVGTGFDSEIINAMATCYNYGAQVISMSLGSDAPQGSVDEDPICKMVKTLTERGVIMVIAAGNAGPDADTIGSPGCSPYAITVAAIDKDGSVAPFSSRGGTRWPDKPDVAAPGVNIYSGTARGSIIDLQESDAGPGFAAISGTSMATPHVAGLVRLLKSKYPGMTADQFKNVMAGKGQAKNTQRGWGVPTWSMF